MILPNCEIVLGDRGEHEAIIDLTVDQSSALRDALVYYRTARFAYNTLEAADVLALRALDTVTDQAQRLASGDPRGVLRLSLTSAEALNKATELYLSERDVESYQPIEERERISALNELAVPVLQLVMDLRAAVLYSAENPPALALA